MDTTSDPAMKCDVRDCNEVRGYWLEGLNHTEIKICDTHRKQLDAHTKALLAEWLGA